MKLSFFQALIFLLAVCYSEIILGQGCSDAGICTINSFKPNDADSTSANINQFHVGLSGGKADNALSVFGVYVEYNRPLSDKVGINVKLSGMSQSNKEISRTGLSDVFLNSNLSLSKSTSMTAGLKIPLTDGNTKKNDLPLPMDFQSSLGTLDLILGISIHKKQFQFVAAVQQPVSQNKNTFLSDMYSSSSTLRDFQSTNKYKRSGDALIRLSYKIDINDKLTFTPGILPIYHLGNDKYTDETGGELSIAGSKGLTLNGNLYVDYAIAKNHTIQLGSGAPFIVRDKRPDGLTRKFVLNLEFITHF